VLAYQFGPDGLKRSRVITAGTISISDFDRQASAITMAESTHTKEALGVQEEADSGL
jgi:hypothetical protein